MSDPTRDDVRRALVGVTSNAMNYPDPSVMLGEDTGHLRGKIVDAVINLYKPALQSARAEAWDEGNDAGEICAMDAASPDHVCQRNPYRKGGPVKEYEVIVYTTVREQYSVQAESEAQALEIWPDSELISSECEEITDTYVNDA